MQIISDFHDYYDIGMKNGCDPQLPYRRFRCEENIPHIEFKNYRYRCYFEGYCNTLYFGFAGKVYPALVETHNSGEIIYDFVKIDDAFCENMVTIQWYGGKKTGSGRWWRYNLKEAKSELARIYNFKNGPELLNLFEQFRTAIFVYQLGEEKIVINERLNVYGFQKVLPPMQAFQELEMYVGANLTKPTIEEPPISDKIKAEIHGFDEYSFRKDKKQ